MAKLTIHDDTETVEELRDELPAGVSWAAYLLECVQMRKRVEGRDLVLRQPHTTPVEENHD